MVAGENTVFSYKFKSSGGDHSQGGVGLSREEWEGGPLASCARATRGLGRPSLDARSGRPSRPPSRERRCECGRSMRGQTRRSPVLVQRARACLSGSSGTLPATFDASTALPYIVRMFTVIETPTFVRLASNCWNDEDRTNFITFIAANPDAGDVMPGSGGLRKVRWGTAGRGKRGGVCV